MELNFISNKFNLIAQNNNKCICSPMFCYNAISTLVVEKRFMICQYYIKQCILKFSTKLIKKINIVFIGTKPSKYYERILLISTLNCW